MRKWEVIVKEVVDEEKGKTTTRRFLVTDEDMMGARVKVVEYYKDTTLDYEITKIGESTIFEVLE